MPDLAAAVAAVAAEMAAETERGTVATYIPELGDVPLAKFGLAVVTAGGETHVAGDADEPFSIQSCSKPFALAVALGLAGDSVWDRVGREPSGSAFNSIVQLEAEQGRPRNPFINAGAIVVADIINGACESSSEGARKLLPLPSGEGARGVRTPPLTETPPTCDPRGGIGQILDFLRARAGDPGTPDMEIDVDPAVAWSEAASGFRNVALANYMKSFGTLRGAPDDALATYFQQCAIAMSCRQLARAARFLMTGGIDPDGTRIVTAERTRRILALMLTCGHYDASGDFAFRVGLPAKSGVGGGIVAVVPGRATIAAWSPGLGSQGNSVLGTLALERLAGRMGWSVFNPEGVDRVNPR